MNMAEELGYDKLDMLSIFEYSRKLIGHSLLEVVGEEAIQASPLKGQGKGGLEHMLEALFFKYEINSDTGPDFREAGVELKGTGLKRLKKDGRLQIKERLVCDMINYEKVVGQPFEESLFYLKCRVMLLMFYLYEKGVAKWDLKFIYSVLWKLTEKDLLIIRHDYEVIVDKIRQGKAHELSEGDTEYLGACRKGGKNSPMRRQPCSETLAHGRAFSLKPSYMRTVLAYVEERNTDAVSNFEIGHGLCELASQEELKMRSFEDIVLARFQPYYGKSYLEICSMMGVSPSSSKCRLALLSHLMASQGSAGMKALDVNQSEEFQKSGIRLKTLTSYASGNVKEDMSFENIDYQEIMDTDEWVDSRLYELFTSRFLFVHFQQPEGERRADFSLDRLVLRKAFFWTMPPDDLATAQEYWEDIRSHVLRNEIEAHFFWSIADHKKFHVRPKAANASDLTENPHGGKARKYCYWFNKEYIRRLLVAEENH